MALAVVAGPLEAGQKPESWRVAFDDDGSEFRRSLAGTLELVEGRLVFTADNRQVRWSIALADVRAIAPSQGYGADSRAVMIESLAGERLYLAVLDRHFLFANPKKAVQKVNAALSLPAIRAARAAQVQRLNAAAVDDEDQDEVEEKGGA